MRIDRRGFLRCSAGAALLNATGCGLWEGGDELAGRRQPEAGWTALFDGRSLEGWTAYDQSGKQAYVSSNWVVRRGSIIGSGELSHLYSPRGDYRNFRYRAEMKINDGGNSGMYVRASRGAGFPFGYEAQVNSTHTDPVRTGSLYGHVLITKRLVPPDTWFFQEVEAVENRITVKVNGDTLYEFIDPKNTHRKGYFAFQQHDPGSEVRIRRVEVMELPA